jgi:acetamidase/formamidase
MEYVDNIPQDCSNSCHAWSQRLYYWDNQSVCPLRVPILGAGGSPGDCMKCAKSDCRADRRSQEKSDGDERGVIL